VTVVYTVKIILEEQQGEEKRKKQEKEFEEFIHRYRDLLKPHFVYDPVMVERFKIEARAIMRELDLGFRERMLAHQMMVNVRRMEEGKRYEYTMIGGRPASQARVKRLALLS